MKKQVLFLFLGIFSLVLLSRCSLDRCTEKSIYQRWTPIYKKVDEIRLDVKAEAPRELQKPGKLYFYNGYVFINEINEGFHIIDNRNPASPRNVAFMKIPGSIDVAVKDNILLADSYIDLVCVDISNPEKPKLARRVENVFTNFSLNQQLGYLVDYKQTTETVELDCNSPYYGQPYFSKNSEVFVTFDQAGGFSGANFASTGSTTKPSTGVGGSMARFTIAKDHMYAIDQANLKVFDIKTANSPIPRNVTTVSWGIETLFPYGDKLFVGSNAGMFIYDIAKAESPSLLSKFEHARACDPVFVKDDIAYVTLRSGTPCQGFSNQLEVIDVKDLKSPKILKIYPMSNPHGLSIEDETLFLCEGKFGLKTFGVKDIMNIDKNQISTFGDLHAYDVITLPKSYSSLNKPIALVIGDNGFYQYDISDKSKMQLLSTINVKK